MKDLDALFVSPHLDDAIYSCGGTLAKLIKEKNEVLIATVFSASPLAAGSLSSFAQEIHKRWQQANPDSTDLVEIRRTEDAAACEVLNIEYTHLDFLDCIYRNNSQGWLYDTDEKLFGTVDDSENELKQEIIQKVQLIENLGKQTKVYCPLAIGDHVDHQLVKQALTESDLADQLIFYQDYPYVETFPDSLATQTQNMDPTEEPISYSDVELKIKAMAAYSSQVSTFWNDEQDLANKVKAYQESQNNSERYWIPGTH